MVTLPHASQGVDPERPAPARVYDYLLGGGHNFDCDRQAADRVLTLVPEVKDCAWANRGFHQRAARWIAERGVRQFIDIGSGLPTVGNTHEVVQLVDPDCRVVYVDSDPMVRQESQRLVTDSRRVRVVHGDLRDPDSILANPDVGDLIDFGQPAALLLTAVVHFVADEFEPAALVRRLVNALAPGSYVALSHLTSDRMPLRSVNAFHELFERGTEQIHFRSQEEIAGFFAGLELLSHSLKESEGALSFAGVWGAEDATVADSDGSRWLYCGVARRP
jgi:O-methyltransferase involved in polyketide biosynthesis